MGNGQALTRSVIGGTIPVVNHSFSRLCGLILVLGLGLAAQMSFGQAVPFKPLTGSQWAKDNPGLLPYEKCIIRAQYERAGLWSDSGGSLIYGEHYYFHDIRPRLYCWSEKLDLAFAIPIELGTLRHFGLNLDTSMIDNNRKMTVTRLQGRSVADFLSKFSGAEIGFGIGFGGGAQIFRGKKGILIRDLHGDLKLGFNLGFVHWRINERSIIGLQECRGDPFMILGPLSESKIAAQCGTEPQVAVDFKQIREYRFFKIN